MNSFSKIRNPLHILKVAFMWVRFLQVPIFAALAAGGLAFVAWKKIGPYALVRGAYDGMDGTSFLVAPFAVFYAIALWDVSRVILEYGPARFRLRPDENCVGLPNLIGRVLLAVLFTTVPVFTALACHSTTEAFGWPDWAAWIISPIAMLAGYRWLFVTKHRLLVRLINSVPLLRNVRAEGYVYVDDNGRKWGIGAGHVQQVILFVFCMVFVRLLYLPSSEAMPSVVYVLVAFLGTAWILSGLGFFLTYHRIPLFLAVVAWVSVGGFFFHKPYHFRVIETGKEESLPKALQILNTPYADIPRSTGPPPDQPPSPIRRRIAVAAIGGGIHSGAWEAEVLTRLQELPGCEDFHKRICSISGTSGGAYGAMHYAHAMYGSKVMENCSSGTPLDENQKQYLSNVRGIVQMPSLGAVVRSLAYDDLPGYFYPQFSALDRGNAMEQRWAANGKSGLDQVTLADWAERAASGRMPAVLFTSGTEECGRPMIFGSSRVADWNWNAEQTDKPPPENPDLLKNYTVPVVTGARLSASFPYVSPVAAPEVAPVHLRRVEHQMDGGYYDNYGMVALNRWLEDGLTELDRLFEETYPKPTLRPALDAWEERRSNWINSSGFGHLLIIQIRYKSQPTEIKNVKDGFFHQIAAPLNGLYNSRVAGQRLRSDEQFDIFCRYWKKQGVVIDNALFDYDGDAPLSWHLTPADKIQLKDQGEAVSLQYQEYVDARKRCDDRPVDSNYTQEMKLREIAALDVSNPIGSAAYRVANFIAEQ